MTETASADIDVNGVTLRVRQAGDPAHPTVVLCHGFPELAYSWRHQIPVLANAGFRVVAPDLHFVGVHFLRRRRSALLFGVGDDAAATAARIATRAGLPT